jgi:hypothetical protein
MRGKFEIETGLPIGMGEEIIQLTDESEIGSHNNLRFNTPGYVSQAR